MRSKIAIFLCIEFSSGLGELYRLPRGGQKPNAGSPRFLTTDTIAIRRIHVEIAKTIPEIFICRFSRRGGSGPEQRTAARQPASGSAARVRHGDGGWTGGFTRHVRGSREAGAGGVDGERTKNCRRELAQNDGARLRTAQGTA